MNSDFFSLIFNAFLLVGVIIALKDRGRIEQLMKKIVYLQESLAAQSKQIDILKQQVKSLTPPTAEEELAKKASLIDEIRDRMDAEFDEVETTSDVASPESKVPPEPQASQKADASQTSDSSEDFGLRKTPEADLQPQLSQAAANTSAPEGDSTQSTETDSGVSANYAVPQSAIQSAPANPAFSFEDLLKGNGIFWLGALVLAIGGVFLAKYSIEAGLLPPSVRVILGAIFGVVLVVSAELVNQYKEKLKVNTPYISAALASGGVITCFAMALVSFDFYQFISPNIAFGLLALISLIATWLTLRFGPVLAGIGIIGSYSVPALVSTGSNNVVALLIYVFFVSLSAVWVAEYVKQKWVWWQSFTGHFAWFIVAAIVIGKPGNFAILMLCTIASLYLYVLVGILGWKLNQTMSGALSVKALLMPRKEQGVVLLTLFIMAAHLFFHNEFSHVIWACLLLSLVIMVASYRHSALDSWPYLMLAFALFSYFLMPEAPDLDDHLFLFTGKYLFIQIAVLVALAYCVFMTRVFTDRNAYLLLLVIAPVCLYGLSYITSTSQAELYLYPVWAAEMLIIGAMASYAAMKTRLNTQQVAYLLLANAMLTLSMTMLLSASTLTLALATQVASMSYLSWKYKVDIPDWLYKIALMVVLTRLTFAPWLADYKDESILGIHWTLIVYPAVLAIMWFAGKYSPSPSLKLWFTGVFIHVVALLVTTETSYLLIGDYPNFFDLSYREGILLALNWLVLSGVYLWRSQLTQTMVSVYKVGGLLLLLAVTLIHLDISLLRSPFVQGHFIGEGLINWTILQWLLPAVVLYFFARFTLLDKQYHVGPYAVMAVFGFFFINGEIRNLFHEGYLILAAPFSQAELYTYSIVWLVISTVTIFAAQHLNHKPLLNAGFIGLALVILKAFGVDMSHLEGLFRALSFIGLGLCLVGIGWLFQKMQVKTAPP